MLHVRHLRHNMNFIINFPILCFQIINSSRPSRGGREKINVYFHTY